MRILILSDIHANLAALESVLADAEGEYDRIWCLGDVVGYGPKPNECTDLIRAHDALCVLGNHDWAVLGVPDIDVDAFNPHARQAVLWTREVLNDDNRRYLETLAAEPIRPDGVEDILITHASPREPVLEYVLTPSIAMENFAEFVESICLVGHTHKPAIYRWQLHDNLEGEHDAYQDATVDALQPQLGTCVHLYTSSRQRLIVNPGSVGQPRDNDARASYAIFDLEEMSWRYQRVQYPVELTQSQMRAVSLPRRLVDRLSFGW